MRDGEKTAIELFRVEDGYDISWTVGQIQVAELADRLVVSLEDVQFSDATTFTSLGGTSVQFTIQKIRS